MSLVFVDSESKAKTLSAQLDIEMEGVVVQEAPMVIRHDAAIGDLHTGKVGFRFAPSDSGKKIKHMVHDDSGQDVIIAFDNDQRGDYWSWMIQGYLNSSGDENRVCKRVSLEGLQRDLLQAAMDKPADCPCSSGAAFYIRSLFNGCLVRHLQRLIGTSAGPANLPLDYTTLTILFLLAGRHNMIAPGTSPAGVKLLVKVSSNAGGFKVWLKNGPEVPDDGFITDSAQVKNILSELQGQTFVLESIKKKVSSVSIPEPLDLSTLLHDGHCLLGIQPGEVWGSLIQLYHGVEVDGVWTGLISDPYGNVNEGSGEILDQIRAFLNDAYGENGVEARECNPRVILPLQPNLTGDALRGVVTEKTAQLYELIRSRAMMSQMAAPHGDEMEVDVRAGDFVFTCHGMHVEQAGFLQENSHNEYDMLQLFSAQLQEGQSLEGIEMVPQAAANPSASQYTFLSLLEELADFSIVLSSRLPNILQKMVEGQYIRTLPDGTFLCLENTKKVVHTVNRAFPKMQGINLSAYFEQTVTEVISGRKNIDFALKQFDQNLQIHGVSFVKKTAPSPVIPRGKRSKNIIKSPVKDTPEIEKTARAGDQQQYAESTQPAVEESEVVEEGKTQPGREVEVESEEQEAVEAIKELTREEEEAEDLSVGERGEQKQPEALDSQDMQEREEEDVSESLEPEPEDTELQGVLEVPKEPEVVDTVIQSEEFTTSAPFQEEREDIPCPFCGNDYLLVKQTSADKIYYECSVSNCEFIAWARPHAIFCPQCKSPYLVEKKGAEGKILQCPKAGCRYEQPAASEEKSAPAKKKKKVLVRRKKGSGAVGSKKRKVVVRRKR
jgi:DNA topoisomerase IA